MKNWSLILLFIWPTILTGQAEISNKLIWGSPYFSQSYLGDFRSTADGQHYTLLEREESGMAINIYAYKTGEKVRTLFRASLLPEGTTLSDYEWNEKEQVLILKTELERIYRHSDKANYYLYSIPNESIQPATDFSKGKIQLGTLSPGGKHFAFVRENNLFVIDLGENKEIALTKDGQKNEIINGLSDWVYEEEFSNDRGFYWSPNGDRIAYYRFDERRVKTFLVNHYGQLYPEWDYFKYPKAGEENSKISIHIVSLADATTTTLQTGNPEYIPRIKWTKDNDQLAVMRLNRHQNHLDIVSYDVTDPMDSGRVIYDEVSETYININDNLIFLEDGEHFLWNSERGDYNHIYLYHLEKGLVNNLTSGTFDVKEFKGVDQKRKRVYFTAALFDPKTNELAYVSLNGGEIVQLSDEIGTHDADFSADYSYYINRFSSADTPDQYSLHKNNGKRVRMLIKNEPLQEALSTFQLPKTEFSQIVTERGDSLWMSILRPTDFDPSKKYPVLFNIYGGPESQRVRDAWGGRSYIWNAMMAEKGFIMVTVDPRGTASRGKAFKHSTYLQLGKYETEDFISAANHFAKLDYVDANRIGIMGWSYGGYMALNGITQGSEVFSTAVSIAPVTHWKFYDTIYTERYMRTPEENKEGYDSNSPVFHAEKLKGKLLIIHGDADDNVHVQNTHEMVEALVQADKQFELFIYPNKNHGIYGGNTRNHLFEMITRFIEENL